MRYYGSTATSIATFGKDTPELKAFLITLRDRLPGAERCRELMTGTHNPKALTHRWYREDMGYITCPVMVKEKKRISIGNTSFTHIASVNKPSEKGLANAANFIQSLDSLVMARIVKIASEQGYELYGVHDSFWCHPNYMQQTRENYLSIMIDLASKPIMTNWYNSMMGTDYKEDSQSIIDNFISKIKDAEYFLS